MATTATHRLDGVDLEGLPAGKHSDGGGLTLLVKATGRRSWTLRVTLADGKRKDRGLGSYPAVSLDQARKRAATVGAETARDAASTRKAANRKPTEPDMPTFGTAARLTIEALAPTWRNPRHGHDWLRSFEIHAGAIMGKRLDEIRRADVLDVLRPLLIDRPRTAKALRQRIRKVFSFAMVTEERLLSNPAGEGIDAAMITRTGCEHHRAVGYGEVREALKIIDRSGAALPTRLCLRFTILTATRAGEARGARWAEIDFDTATWNIPGERMKAGRPHRVPLSAQALDVLTEAKALDDGSGLVFPSRTGTGRTITGQALRGVLNDNMIDSSVHGFRSSFRAWASEETSATFEAAELALAHATGDRTVQAYVRDADKLCERRPLMQAWADYIA